MTRIISALDKLFPAPKDGAPGADAVMYSIECANTNPNVTNEDKSVTLTAYKTVGSNRIKCTLDKHLYLVDYKSVKFFYENPATVVIPKGNTTVVPILLMGDNSVLATCTISPVVNGQNGGVGPMMYYAGEWQSGVAYVRTAEVTPLVSHGDDQFFYYPAQEGSLLNSEPSSTNTAWKQQQKVPLLLSQLLMAEFGKIASAVFSGDFMMSQYGLDGNDKESTDYKAFDGDPTPYIGKGFAPNICFDFLRGEAWLRKAHIFGDIDAGSINVNYKDLTESDAIKNADREYTLVNDLSIIVNVGAAGQQVLIHLPYDKEYIGKHVYLMDSNNAPSTRSGTKSITVKSGGAYLIGEGDAGMTGHFNGYASINFTGGVVHLMGLPVIYNSTKYTRWGIINRTTLLFNYNV